MGRRTFGAAWRVPHLGGLLAAVCALTLAGCNPDKQGISAAQPRGATVAFDSLDGLPPGQFQKLVQNLNEEAQSRRLAVTSREQPSAYRVRGYLAVKVTKRQTIVSWVWDVFDQEEQRTLRISGEENAKIRHRDVWAVADDAMLRRIAHSSMDQLAAFLTSSEVAPGTSHRPRKRGSRQRTYSSRRPRQPAYSAFPGPRPIRYRQTARATSATTTSSHCRAANQRLRSHRKRR